MAEKNFTDYAKTGVESTRTSTPTRSQYLVPSCLPVHIRQGYGCIQKRIAWPCCHTIPLGVVSPPAPSRVLAPVAFALPFINDFRPLLPIPGKAGPLFRYMGCLMFRQGFPVSSQGFLYSFPLPCKGMAIAPRLFSESVVVLVAVVSLSLPQSLLSLPLRNPYGHL